MSPASGDGVAAPPVEVVCTVIDKAAFEVKIPVTALRVEPRECDPVLKTLKNHVLRIRAMRNVVSDETAPTEAPKRLVLLSSDMKVEDLPEEERKFVEGKVEEGKMEIVRHEVVKGYDVLSADEALRKLLPSNLQVPSAFEHIGHVAHLNLRDEYLPYKFTIGQVLLDKNPGLKTIVNKLATLSNEFRTFDMEVIAGPPVTPQIVKENGFSFELDFREVYWNSRLSTERTRVLGLLPTEKGVVLDMMAGAGAMSCFSARHGCKVLSNDLNPAGARFMETNARRNRVDKSMTVFNKDARDFIRELPKETWVSDGVEQAHVIMNLPAIALEFLDVFKGAQIPVPTHIHCYCFARSDPPSEEIHPRVEKALGVLPKDVKIVEVRDVAPNKRMYCVEFLVPEEVMNMTVEDASAESDAKRRKVE